MPLNNKAGTIKTNSHKDLLPIFNKDFDKIVNHFVFKNRTIKSIMTSQNYESATR